MNTEQASKNMFMYTRTNTDHKSVQKTQKAPI